MRTRILVLALVVGAAAVASRADGQGVTEPTPVSATPIDRGPAGSAWVIPSGPYLIAGVLAGLVLATAFQMILTNLSVAAGISLIGPLDEEGRPKDGRRKNAGVSLPSAEEVGEEIREITGAFGLWAVITTALALFFACWLAVSLSLTESVLLGAILGLVIWGLFYILLTALEGLAITSAVGSLIKLAMSGFRSVASTAASLFEPSAKRQAAGVAEEMTRAVADVLERDGDAQRLKRELRSYLRELKPRPIEPSAIRRQIAGLLDDLELHAVSAGADGPVIDVEELSASLRRRGGLGAEDVESVRRGLAEAFEVVREEASDPAKEPADAAIDGVQRLTGRSRRSAEAGRRRLEEFLRRTDLPELDPDGLKRDLARLITEPRVGAEALRVRVAMMDRDTVRSLLEARGDLAPGDADRIIESVEQAVSSALGLAGSGRAELDRRLSEAEGGVEAVRRRAERKIRSYLASLGRPELDYDGLRQDVALLFHDPKAGAEALRDRWQSMDRDTLRALIASSRSDLDEDDAEALLAQLESVRDEAIAQADKLKARARRELRRARREALEQAEEIRKVASEAAWWAFGTAAVSGAAAVVGGVLGASEVFGHDARGRDRSPAVASAPIGDRDESPSPRSTAAVADDRGAPAPGRIPVVDAPEPQGIGPATSGGRPGTDLAAAPAPGQPRIPDEPFAGRPSGP